MEERLAVGKEGVLGVLSELKEGLDIRNFRPLAKAMTVKIELKNSIIVARAMQLPGRPIYIEAKPWCRKRPFIWV